MNIITQEAKKKQAIVKYALRKGKSEASRVYGVSLSSVKRWCKQYDGTWQSLLPKSRRPHSHPNRHTKREERQIRNSFTDHIVILTGTQKEKKDKLEILSKSAMKDMDGMEYTVI